MNSKSDTIDAEIDEQYNKIVKQFDSVHVPAPQRKEILAAHHEIIRLEKAKLEANQEALLLREREIGKAEGAREYAAFVAKDNVENPKSCVMPCCLAELSRLSGESHE